ncbi:formate--tetrahydrofolate ligase [Hyphomonas neptunium ATCC 15444]|uniref:Formate--tetrahydrofolate ligase n=2 Tax=Hyphomonas TaxID=85 RepID=FTHS_HYPNA|nr:MULTISPECIES: formate--tetrahydrofolate ligase [Hyphomonas]Q0BX04.1 RecName: Full=Formate--tetrahydrofolate ligase; AltName: Full=Formyltetrahydrofolate synthetase; Short=FHS; Short=FTHFS [Hyphomonas neptunium ATCC 15444]ABI77946.1 formate--tetrahydrofolate ligase [Hyphomonas neptunium ATCC 15444]KCZ92011.1 formate--tetrahydrofolate ligase [Hyphomonas hirschiana VP5]
MASDIEIARGAKKKPIQEVAARAGVSPENLIPYGHDKAKISAAHLAGLAHNATGKLILVTAINPTPAGEGKTTTSIGLADAMNRIGANTLLCLREPSLGPCFGMKGGATGGGLAQIVPMEDINLHFTGDFHAITSAHNLLSTMIDNHIHWGGEPKLEAVRTSWRRVMDMNDRSLRNIVSGLGGPGNGSPSETGFDITVASEVMAILCLATDAEDLEARLARIIVGYTSEKEAVTAADIKATGAMMALLRDAMLPNLVQTLENNPCLVHGGPFANIAHGCNSVMATSAALKMADYVVTEAGFGADLGAEKFLNIKCRQAGLAPDAVVLVATIRALKMHGGLGKNDLGKVSYEALESGLENLGRHIGNLRSFGLPVIVAINRFTTDTEGEVHALQAYCEKLGVPVSLCTHWAEGGKGTEDLARGVTALIEKGEADFKPLYPDDMPLLEKIETVAKSIYRAGRVETTRAVRNQLAAWEKAGFGHLPVCMAKTQYSFSTDPALLGAPEGHVVRLREVRLAAGAGFVVAICGDIMTMPGLPRRPAAEHIHLNRQGQIEGLN